MLSKQRFKQDPDCADCGLPRSVCKRKPTNAEGESENMPLKGSACPYKGALGVYAAAFVYKPGLAT